MEHKDLAAHGQIFHRHRLIFTLRNMIVTASGADHHCRPEALFCLGHRVQEIGGQIRLRMRAGMAALGLCHLNGKMLDCHKNLRVLYFPQFTTPRRKLQRGSGSDRHAGKR